MGFSPGQGWVCGQCGYCLAPPEPAEEDDFETVGDLWDDEQRRIRSMSRPGGSRASGRRRKYRRVYAPPQPLNDDEETARLRAVQAKKLPLRLRKRYVMELQRRYAEAKTKREKSAILNEMQRLGYSRWRAWTRMKQPFKSIPVEIDRAALSAALMELRKVLTSAQGIR